MRQRLVAAIFVLPRNFRNDTFGIDCRGIKRIHLDLKVGANDGLNFPIGVNAERRKQCILTVFL